MTLYEPCMQNEFDVAGLLRRGQCRRSRSARSLCPPTGLCGYAHPAIAQVDRLVSHTEEIMIHRPLDVVLDAEAKASLEKTIDRSSSLPGVSGTHTLTKGDYGSRRSRRLTCLTDGSTLVGEVLENVRDEDSEPFRYVVWNSTSEEAHPIE
jgi:hypothetical protein